MLKRSLQGCVRQRVGGSALRVGEPLDHGEQIAAHADLGLTPVVLIGADLVVPRRFFALQRRSACGPCRWRGRASRYPRRSRDAD